MTRVERRTFLAASLASAVANALGRTPVGGSLRLSVPLGVGALEPHSLDEPLAALFGPAVADPLYALDAGERPYPALATALPEPAANGARVRITLRPGLVTAAGKRLDARDVIFSLDRAQKQGGAAVLGELGRATADPSDRLSL